MSFFSLVNMCWQVASEMGQRAIRQAHDDFVNLLSSVVNEIKPIGKASRTRASTAASARFDSVVERGSLPGAASPTTAQPSTNEQPEGHPFDEGEIEKVIEQMKKDTASFIQYTLEEYNAPSDRAGKTLTGFFSYHAVTWLIHHWNCKDRNQARCWLDELLNRGLFMNTSKNIP